MCSVQLSWKTKLWLTPKKNVFTIPSVISIQILRSQSQECQGVAIAFWPFGLHFKILLKGIFSLLTNIVFILKFRFFFIIQKMKFLKNQLMLNNSMNGTLATFVTSDQKLKLTSVFTYQNISQLNVTMKTFLQFTLQMVILTMTNMKMTMVLWTAITAS